MNQYSNCTTEMREQRFILMHQRMDLGELFCNSQTETTHGYVLEQENIVGRDSIA